MYAQGWFVGMKIKKTMTTTTIKKAARIRWADHEFRIPKTRIPDPTSKSVPDSRFQITLHGTNRNEFYWLKDLGGGGGGFGAKQGEI